MANNNVPLTKLNIKELKQDTEVLSTQLQNSRNQYWRDMEAETQEDLVVIRDGGNSPWLPLLSLFQIHWWNGWLVFPD